jgi:hypothetical protein
LLVVSSIAYALYALNSPQSAFESTLPAAWVSIMVTSIVLGFHHHRRRNGRRR